MSPVTPGSYRFSKQSLVDARRRLHLSQAGLAAKVGVPKNTVSRWETGATTPNADALAKIYSIAREKGIMPKFFAPVKAMVRIRDRALVYWDLDSLNPFGWNADVGKWDNFIEAEVYKRIPKPAHEQFKVFSETGNSPTLGRLQDLNWDIWEDSSALVRHSLSESGQYTETSSVFLITANPACVELIEWLKDDGVLVYLLAPSNVSELLIRAVGKKRWINLDGLPGLPQVWNLTPEFGI